MRHCGLSNRGAARQSEVSRSMALKVRPLGSGRKIFRSRSAQQAPQTGLWGQQKKGWSERRMTRSEVQWNQAQVRLWGRPETFDFFRFAGACIHLIFSQRVF